MDSKEVIRLQRADYPEQVGISSKTISELLRDFKEHDVEVHSLMILREGKVAYETWAAPYAPEYPHMMYSVSKSFTSTAVGFAIDEGLMTLETRLIDIFPEYKPKSKDENLEKLNVHHLLSMQSGKNVSVFSDKAKNHWIKDYFDASWKFAPGDGHWQYISENQYMLCAMLTRITGMSVVEYLTPRLFEPLGIDVPFWEHDIDGIEAGGWGLYLKTEDLAKFMLCYQQRGKFNGKQVIPEKWTRLAQKVHANNSPFTKVIDSQCGYGYCFWRCGGINGYRADGMFSQFGIVSNDDDIVFVITAGEISEQKTRDCIWRHFNKLIIENDSEPTPDVKPELAPLDDDLEAAERSPIEKDIEGRTIYLQRNLVLNAAGFPLGMLPIPIVYMSGDRAGNMDNVVLHFNDDNCTMAWDEGDEHNTIICGMDGKARTSPITLAGMNFTAFSTAAWIDEKTLEIHMRPVGGVCMRIIKLTFNGNIVKLSPSSRMTMTDMAENLALDVDTFFPPILHRFGLVAFDQLPGIIDAPVLGRLESEKAVISES